ncbi:hypothetical protein evm_011495 [Chilo suppressalis]|nr:hypothetical protein evm_011495 [Chilo suppressalis]
MDNSILHNEHVSLNNLVGDKAEGVSSQVLSIVRTVLERCKKESEQNALQIPIDQYEARVSYYTGFPPEVIFQIKDYNEKSDEKTSTTFDVAERIVFIRICQNLLLGGMSPTYADVYKEADKLLDLPSYHNFRKTLYKLGFYYMPTDKGYVLTEDPILKYERYQFLSKIKKHRSKNTPICYIDERLINKQNTFLKPEVVSDKEYTLLDDTFLLLHAICDKQIKNSLFSNVLSKDFFKKWLFDVLLKVLTPGTIIIMDSRDLHGKQINNTITRYNTKQDMLKWLKFNNVPCNEDMHKADLYELTQKFTRREKIFDIDRLLKSFGYEVLRIPFGCNNLSITDLLWNYISSYMVLKPKELDSPLLMKEFILTKIHSSLSEKWDDFEKLIIAWENEFLNLDIMTESILDKDYKFQVDKILNKQYVYDTSI